MVIGQTWLVATHCPAIRLEATQFFGQVMSPAITKFIIAKEGSKMEICDNNVCHKVHRFLLVLFLDTQETINLVFMFSARKRRELWVAYA
jgi:hypothetical protein